MKVTIDNLWRRKFMALEKLGKLTAVREVTVSMNW